VTRIVKVLVVIAGLVPAIAAAQQILPANHVWGRLATPSTGGPAQAIPFATLFANAGIAAGPQSCSSHNWFNLLSSGGALGCAQPSFADLTSTIAAAQLIPPSPSTLGGVQSKDCSSGGQFLQKINTDGTETCATPAGGGNVTGPGSSTANHLAAFNNTAGTLLEDAGPNGTVGQQLTGAGAGSLPTWQSGGWTLLATLTASNSASLADNTHFTAVYNDYLLVFTNILPATTGVTCQLQVQAASVVQTGSYVATVGVFTGASATTTTFTTFIPCSYVTSVLNSAPGISGEMSALKFDSGGGAATVWEGDFAYLQGAAVMYRVSSGGLWNSTSAINGISVSMSSGNITSGTIKIYGRL
jgi:hypothetical protein